MKKVFALVFAAALFICGCGPTNLEILHRSLDNAVGRQTYDDMLVKFGPPTSTAEGDKIFVATWRIERTLHDYEPNGGGVVDYPLAHGREMTLVFDKNTKILKQWKDNHW